MISYKQDAQMILPFTGLINTLPQFPTKAAAIKAGKEFGWREAVRIEKRFEKVWVVGKKMLQPNETAGVLRDEYRFPLLRWDVKDGARINPVVNLEVTRPV